MTLNHNIKLDTLVQKVKVLVIGSKGMLGQDLCSEFKKKGIDSVGWDREDIDITKSEEMNKIDSSFTHIINCAAYTDVDGSESNHELCDAINIDGIRNITDRCNELDIVLVSISTDYVFDGEQESYNEDNVRDPLNYYGLSKSRGEEYIESNLKKYFIVRTAWLFGKNGNNFVKTMIKLGKSKDEIKVVNDQIGSPTYTVDLSLAIIDLILEEKRYGIYHLINSGSCSWFEFAKEIMKLSNLDCKVLPCTSEEFLRDAKRPKYSILNNNKREMLPDWKDALKRYLRKENIKECLKLT